MCSVKLASGELLAHMCVWLRSINLSCGRGTIGTALTDEELQLPLDMLQLQKTPGC